nr:right-handed parallel beta-helix repeat-containing protein [Pedobacter panaciterrae]
MRLFVFFLLCSFNIFAQSNDKTFYVSLSGNDKSPGSIDQPLHSLSAALQKVALLKGGAVTILIRGGIYATDKTINIGSNDNVQRLTISNYKGEKVLLSGGIKIDKSAVRKASANIYQIDLKKAGVTDYGELQQHGHRNAVTAPLELFYNGQAMELARWPNSGFLPVGKVSDPGITDKTNKNAQGGAVFAYSADQPAKWKKSDQVWISGFLANGFANDNVPVKSIDGNKITLNATTSYGVKSTDQASPFRRFFFYNIPEELDSPGEYYLDRETGLLSFYNSGDPADELFVSMCSTPIISLINSANVTLSGLEIAYGRDMGIYAQNTKNINIKNCTVMNMGTVGIGIGKNTSDKSLYKSYEELISFDKTAAFVISSCKVYNTGTGGIFMTGGNRQDLLPAGNVVDNTEIFNYARRNWVSSPGIFLGGVGNAIKNCFIHDSEGQAIMYWGNDHEISYNKIKDVVKEINDQGAVYTGRDRSSTGTRIHNNLFEDLISPRGYMVAAVYIDDGSGGIKVDSNIFKNCGSVAGKLQFGAVHINGGGDNTFANNYFLNCGLAVSMTSWTDEKWKTLMGTKEMSKKLKSDVNSNSALFLKRYPYLKGLASDDYRPGPNKFTNSLCVNVSRFSSNKLVLDSNTLSFSKDPGGAGLKGIKQINTSNIGLRK